jgi:hypothetical protein
MTTISVTGVRAILLAFVVRWWHSKFRPVHQAGRHKLRGVLWMGIFDKLKKAVGGGEPERDTTVAPSQLLRDAGIDPSGLKFGFGTGTISVSGTIADESERAKIIEVLSGIAGIDTVEDHMLVAKPMPEPEPEPAPDPIPEPAPEPVSEPEATTEADAGARTYTVESGDSLWKIAEAMYGNGSKYTKIFDANRDILDDPDRIFPGQVLKIPEQED